MRKKRLFGRCLMPLDLQHFAESGDGAGADGGNGGGAGSTCEGGNAKKDGGTEEKAPPSFDELLKDGHQAEFDRRMRQGIQTALTNAQEKWKALTDNRLSEAEKLAKMNKEEKAQYLSQKHEKELADREAAVTRKELMAEAKNTLTEKKLPIGLAEMLNYTDAESCSKSIDAVEKAFQEAVEAGVKDRLKGGEPPKKVTTQTESLEAEIAKAIRGNY